MFTMYISTSVCGRTDNVTFVKRLQNNPQKPTARPSSSAVGRSRRRQVGSCGVYVSTVRDETSIGTEGTHAVLAGPLTTGVCAGRMGMASKLALFGCPLALVHREASFAKLVGSRLHVLRCH